jgi:hypothetical protein
VKFLLVLAQGVRVSEKSLPLKLIFVGHTIASAGVVPKLSISAAILLAKLTETGANFRASKNHFRHFVV